MTINYEPWGESHEPKRFERTDKSGRWSPLYEKPSVTDPVYMLWIGRLEFGGAFSILMVLMLYWAI